jgi:hypothetical protein
MTDAEVAAAYQQGIVTEDTYCWRDGMADWLPLAQIDSLYEACNATRAVVAPSELQRPPGVASAERPAAGAGYGNGSANHPAPLAAAPAPIARRAGGRAPVGDLFGGVAQAGSEDDVMTSAPAGMPQPRAGEPEKMVGERNENSVLFSLSALTSKGPGGPPKAPAPGVEASGLIDIKQLSAQLHSASEKKRSGIDDIMNLAGGGAFSPSLTAPTLLTAPSVAEYSADVAAGKSGALAGKNRVLFLAIGGGGALIAAAIGATMMLMQPKGAEGKAPPSTSASETPSASATTEGAVAAASAGSPTPAASGATASANAASSDTASAKTPETTKTPEAKTTSGAPKTASPTETKPAAAPKENSLAAAMAGGAAPAPAPAAQAGSEQAFNMGEAKARLAAAASAAQGCKKPDGPTGSGRVVVMFAPSGAAQSATVSGPPFEGTPTGACVAARFRAVHVPAFGGSPFSVSKSFSVN